MNESILHVIQALNAIEQRFYGLDDFTYHNGELVDGNRIRNLERRFMIRFSMKFEAIRDDLVNVYRDVKCDFEIPKRFIWGEDCDPSICSTFEHLNSYRDVDMNSYFETQPDFLVHESQGSWGDQRLIIEAKANPNTSRGEALKDIFHIMIYANHYHFSNSILLLANIDLRRWLSWLCYYKTRGLYLGRPERLHDVYVISKMSAQSPAVVNTLAYYLDC
jgi:hypothetical protein